MMEQTSIPVSRDEYRNRLCHHYWVIEVAAGPVSRGVCQLCQEVRQFKNYIEETSLEDDEPMALSEERRPS